MKVFDGKFEPSRAFSELSRRKSAWSQIGPMQSPSGLRLYSEDGSSDGRGESPWCHSETLAVCNRANVAAASMASRSAASPNTRTGLIFPFIFDIKNIS
jgi:hypothetical protein